MKVDVRAIAATNKDLEEEIDAGRFREDLYFRLSVIPVYVPPLRERPEDIPLLVKHFAELFNRESSFKPRRFTSAALEFLQQQRWRGNIRELRNTVERLLIMSRSDAVDVADLKDAVRVDSRPAAPPVPSVAPAAVEVSKEKPGTLREFKESAERAFLVDKLRENAWNISRTAEALDTPRSNLYKKLEQYQISQERDG